MVAMFNAVDINYQKITIEQLKELLVSGEEISERELKNPFSTKKL